jgi:hypothetical protein
MRKHVFIPDTQQRPGVSSDHLEWVGSYIHDKKPDVIVHAGDHWDMPSLNFHGSALKLEGARYRDDIEAGNAALLRLTKAILGRSKTCTPKLILLRGNHENRINRAIGENPRFADTIGEKDFNDVELGWRPVPFLAPITIDGIMYAHYFYNTLTGRPYGGNCIYKLKQIHASFTMGHVQGLDQAQIALPGGRRLRGLVAGSCYLHNEEYIGPQGNKEWRGILVKHEVCNGQYDLMEVSLEYLRRRYG